jgi:ornithine cyclodeaminase/alanine dehydrogenase-like protein (mu-crystallin family)
MSTFLLDRNAIESPIEMLDVINVVNKAFRMCGERKGKISAKTHLSLEHGDFRAMAAALLAREDVKWVDIHPENPYRGLLSM